MNSEWAEYAIDFDYSSDSNDTSLFNFTHQIFYDFYINEFNDIKQKLGRNVDNYIQALSIFFSDKVIAATPSGLHISNIKGENISINNLSSGERKMLLILTISFFLKDVTLCLDEPEISISIMWQSKLLPLLMNETDIEKLLIATHSPFLVEDEKMLDYTQSL
jgi:predicted ATPase